MNLDANLLPSSKDLSSKTLPSKRVTSPQQGIHANLNKAVLTHLNSDFRKPIADYNQLAFEQARQRWDDAGRPPLILDSACGTAESSRHLARQYPAALVLGLDQSLKRLSKTQNSELPDNCLLLRCDCTDFWRLADQHNWRCYKHYLLYPNPYPKTQHLQRRWHGHPAFPSLLAISESIELRTNWQIYADEFAQALTIAGYMAEVCPYQTKQPITAFERKYLNSQHSLWRIKSRLSSV